MHITDLNFFELYGIKIFQLLLVSHHLLLGLYRTYKLFMIFFMIKHIPRQQFKHLKEFHIKILYNDVY